MDEVTVTYEGGFQSTTHTLLDEFLSPPISKNIYRKSDLTSSLRVFQNNVYLLFLKLSSACKYDHLGVLEVFGIVFLE